MEGLVEDGFELRGGTGEHSGACIPLLPVKKGHTSKQPENSGNSALQQMEHIWFRLIL